MLKLLLKIQILSTLRRNTLNKGKKNSAAMILILVALGYVFVVFAGMMLSFSIALCPLLVPNGYGWLFFSLPFLLTFMLTLFFGIFGSQSTLFNAKDNELLLSMPIKSSTILTSRIIMMLLPDYLFELVMVGISAIVYIFFFGIDIVGLLILLLFVVTVPLLAMSVSCLIGWLISLIVSRIRYKQLFTTFISLVFLGLYFWGYYSMMNLIQAVDGAESNDILLLLSGLSDKISAYLPPVRWLGTAIAEHDLIYTLFLTAITVIPFVLVVWLLSASFIRITTEKKGASKAKYTAKPLKEKSPQKALFSRDMKRLLGSSIYLMNSCMGAIMMVVVSVILAFRGDVRNTVISAGLPELVTVLAPIAAIILCAISSMVSVTASSVSLEGKYLWIIKTMPAKTADILFSKVKVHLAIAIPASLISSAILCFPVRPTLLEAIPLFLLPVCFNIFCAMFGLLANLRFPKLDWINEAQPVKQSAASAAGMFLPVAILLVPTIIAVVLFIFTPIPAVALFFALTVVFAALSFVCYKAICGWGVRRFEEL